MCSDLIPFSEQSFELLFLLQSLFGGKSKIYQFIISHSFGFAIADSVLAICYIAASISGNLVPEFKVYTDNRFRPFRRLALITALPPLVDIRSLKPCTLFLFLLFG